MATFFSHTLASHPTIDSAANYISKFSDDINNQISSFDTQSSLWSVASVATFVAFTALAVVGLVATGVFMPVYLPVASFPALVLAMPVATCVKSWVEYSESSQRQADQLRKVEENFYYFNSHHGPAEIQTNLQNREISWLNIPGANVENLPLLNPLLAQAHFLDGKIQEQLQMKEKLRVEALELETSNASENRGKIYDLRNTALTCEDAALKTKIEAAFVNALLRKGILLNLEDFDQSLKQIATVSNTAYHERILGNELNDRNFVNQLLIFNNRSFAPITFDEVKNLQVPELGRRLAAAINSA